MDIDTAPPTAHREPIPSMQLDLPPPDQVMMEVDPADLNLLASSSPHHLTSLNPSSPPPLATTSPATLDHTPTSTSHRTSHPTPPVTLVSSSDVVPWPKIKLDQLFVEWLTRPDSKRWLTSLLDNARRDPFPPSPSTLRTATGSSATNASASPSPAPPGSPVSRLFRAHLPFTEPESPRSPPAPPSPSHLRPVNHIQTNDLDLGKCGPASPLRDSASVLESPPRKTNVTSDVSLAQAQVPPDQITLERVADAIAEMNASTDAATSPPNPSCTTASGPVSAPTSAGTHAPEPSDNAHSKSFIQLDKPMSDSNTGSDAIACSRKIIKNTNGSYATPSTAQPPRIPRASAPRSKRKPLPRFYFPCGRDAEEREQRERATLREFFTAQRTKQQQGVGRAEFAGLVVDVVGLPSYFASIVYEIIVDEFPQSTTSQGTGNEAPSSSPKESIKSKKQFEQHGDQKEVEKLHQEQQKQGQQQDPQSHKQLQLDQAQDLQSQQLPEQEQPKHQQEHISEAMGNSVEDSMTDVGDSSAEQAGAYSSDGQLQGETQRVSQDETGATNSDTTMGDVTEGSGQNQQANGFHSGLIAASSGEVNQDPTVVEDTPNGTGADAMKDFITEDQMVQFYEDRCAKKSKEERLFCVMRQRGAARPYLIPSDFKPLLRALLVCHQGLAFLHATPEFQQRYSETVIERIYFGCTRQHNGRLTLQDMKRSKLLDTLMVVDEEEDINRERRFFSYEHFYVLYCRFWELDANHDLQIDREDLMRYSSHSLTNKIVDRIFGGYARPLDQPDNAGYMSYTDFIWFCLSEEDKTSDTAIDYWFRCVDRDGDGLITMYDMEFFYKEQLQRMESFGHEPVQVKDILCQLLDMIKPKIQPPVIRRRDLKRSRLAGNFFNVLFNLNKFFAIEARDPLHIRQEHATPELTDWDRFAAIEYLRLSAEEEGEEEEAWEDVGEAANPLMSGEAPF